MHREKRAFVHRFRRRFLLRLHMTLILLAAFASGLVTTKILLEMHVNVLWQRYLVAVTIAYLVFLGAVKVWLMYMRPHMVTSKASGGGPDIGAGDVIDGAVEIAGSGIDFDFDFGEGCVLVFGLLLILAIVFAGFYVFWAGPAILAEAAFEAALASALIRRTKQMDAPGWVGSVVRRTMLPFLCVLGLSVGIGFFAQRACPESIKIVHAIGCWLG